MLTLNALIKTMRHNASFGIYGAHTFAHGQMPPPASLRLIPEALPSEPKRPDDESLTAVTAPKVPEAK